MSIAITRPGQSANRFSNRGTPRGTRLTRREVINRASPPAAHQQRPRNFAGRSAETRTSPLPANLEVQCPGLAETLEQLFHMNLASLRGFLELAEVATEPSLKQHANLMVRQRFAQSRELARLFDKLRYQQGESEPGAEKTAEMWAAAITSYDEGRIADFFDQVEEAELMLEDAYLTAARLYSTYGIADLFREHALNICQARQQIEALSEFCLLMAEAEAR